MSARITQIRRPRLPLYMKKRRSWQPVALALILVMLIAGGVLYYLAGRHQRSSAMLQPGTRYTLYQSRYGERKAVRLPDSTFVILNSRSRLYMPEGYPATRELVLDGEAFFSVPEGPQLTVWTDKLKTVTPGATFRLHSLESQQGAFCYVLSGAAHVRKSYHSPSDNQPEDLIAGQSVLANKMIDLMEKETFELEEQRDCLNNRLVFHNTPLPAAFKKMEDWYGVEMEVKGRRGPSKNISGEFSKESLQEMLDALQDSMGFTYRITRDKVVIKF